MIFICLLDPNDDFWIALYKFLKVYYSEETTNNIIKEFKKLHSNYVNSLSYDDIERLAPLLPWNRNINNYHVQRF